MSEKPKPKPEEKPERVTLALDANEIAAVTAGLMMLHTTFKSVVADLVRGVEPSPVGILPAGKLLDTNIPPQLRALSAVGDLTILGRVIKKLTDAGAPKPQVETVYVGPEDETWAEPKPGEKEN